MKLTQVVKREWDGARLGHGHVVYLSFDEMVELERIARERFTAPESMKIQDFLHHIVREFMRARGEQA